MPQSAVYLRGRDEPRLTAEVALSAGQVLQMQDGRAAVLQAAIGAAAGDRVTTTTFGQFTLTKLAGISLLDGGKAYWNFSGGYVTFKKVNSRDFYLGRVVGDAASADTTCVVNLNVVQSPDIDLISGAVLSVPTGTQAAGSTGFGLPVAYGGAFALQLTATNEAQCIDMLSVDRVDKTANPVAEFVVRVAANGSTSAVDLNFGLANGTSTTDADAVTEHVLFHVDGGSLAINAQSKDGTTTVAATDTTKVFTAGSAVANRFELWIDARDLTSVKLYVEGVRVLSGSTFRLDNATGPLGLLAHLEKTVSTATCGPVYLDRAEMRIMQQ